MRYKPHTQRAVLARPAAMAQAAALREDTPLDEEERRRADAALEALPRELRNGAFGGDERAFADLLARCVRGEPPLRCAAALLDVLQWRAAVGADTVRAGPYVRCRGIWAAARQPLRILWPIAGS